MAANLDSLRDRWERMAPRERTLVSALAVTLVVCLLAWVAFSIRDGLTTIEEKNEVSRDALRALAQYRAGAAVRRAEAPDEKIGDKAIDLDTYIDEIVNELSLKSPTYPATKETTKNGFTEITIRIQMAGLSIYELKDLLERIENRKPNVVIKELHIKRVFHDKEKLNLEMTVATYKKAAAEGDKAKEGE